jgi:hypothetical protein
VTREDRVLGLYAHANPVPDPDRLEAELRDHVHRTALEQGRDSMQKTDLHTIESTNRNRRGPWILAAAAAFVAVLAVGALIVVTVGDNTAAEPANPATVDGSTTTAAPPTAGTSADDEAAIRSVVASIEARNSGDWNAWLATLGGEELAGVEPWRNQYEANVAAHESTTINDDDGVGCRVVGSGLHGETLVACDVIVRDDFSGAGGVVAEGQSIFYLLDGKVVTWDDGLRSNDPGDFEMAFLTWFTSAHPDVADGMTAGPNDWNARTPDDIVTVLMYVDEFVAQSDTYPIGG